MKAERQGNKFHLQLDLTELLTLYCLLGEEKISADINIFGFENPDKIRRVLEDFHNKVQMLVIERTPEELQVKFFRP